MGRSISGLCCLVVVLVLLVVQGSNGENPYRFYNWRVTYGNIYPLGVRQQGILINGQFPGPMIDCVTNDNLVINVHNHLNEPFLISWNGLQNRRNSWQDGVSGTNCPIPPRRNFTYVLQAKDQIGSFFYYPSLSLHKASGAFGPIRILSRPRIPIPFPTPAGDFSIVTGDWFKRGHQRLRRRLNKGRDLPFPDGLQINGRGWKSPYQFNVNRDRTYRFRISNVGLTTSVNFRIQGHRLKLIEVEGSHTVQGYYSSLDIHLGQSMSALVKMDQPSWKDYYIVVSTMFTSRKVLTTTSILHYSSAWKKVSGSPPHGPGYGSGSRLISTQINWSVHQARTIRRNLTASGPRPNPQGSYHYRRVKPTRTIMVANSEAWINGKQRYAVNSISFKQPDTPLKLADYFNIGGVYTTNSMPSFPRWGQQPYMETSVLQLNYREFVEIVFQNWENTVQSWHVNGFAFFVVGMEGGQWNDGRRRIYNLRDAVARSTVQVYPRSWTAVYMAVDNVGMWNVRSEDWGRQYLGQQFYIKVFTNSKSFRDELPIPKNALLCGRARGRRTRPL